MPFDELVDRSFWVMSERSHNHLQFLGRLELAHDYMLERLEEYWNDMNAWLRRKMLLGSLDYLEMDFSNAHCLICCCRWTAPGSTLIVSNTPTHTNILGLQHSGDKTGILEGTLDLNHDVVYEDDGNVRYVH